MIGEILGATGRPVALDAHPKFAIASGAAAEAGRIATEHEAALAATAAVPVAAAAATATSASTAVPAAATA